MKRQNSKAKCSSLQSTAVLFMSMGTNVLNKSQSLRRDCYVISMMCTQIYLLILSLISSLPEITAKHS